MEKYNAKELILKHKYLYELICFLFERSVVNSANLLQHLNISRSTLNRLLSQIESYNFVDIKKFGYFNYYYITLEGINFYNLLLNNK